MIVEATIFAGFGGQGVMRIGQLLTYAGLKEGKGVIWYPAYGSEQRGGTANCTVIIDERRSQVVSPVVKYPTSLVILNEPSLLRFEARLMAGGKLFYNSSLVKSKPKREDIDVYPIPANKIAEELGNVMAANMVMLGAMAAITKVVDIDSLKNELTTIFKGKSENIIKLNELALEKGREAALQL
nr:2-oxoacid:acceptor oxidoreductase family protein [Carboxydothermus hydrogenoformans]